MPSDGLRRGCLLAAAVGVTLTLPACQTGLDMVRMDDEPPWQHGEPGSHSWWHHEASRPVGSRQVHFKGKYWPPYPRPVGERQQLSHRFHAAHYWPYPYTCQDRAFVNGLVRQQADRGWMTATTLYSYHFHPETHRLNQPGQMRLRWILQQTPANRRVPMVQRDIDAAVNQKRLASVRRECERILADDRQIPEIALRTATPPGRAAREVDQIRETDLQTQLPPQISNPISGGGGGGFGGGGSFGGGGQSN